MPLLALDRPTVTVVRVGPSDWPSGVRVVCAAQAATGVPPTSVEALIERTRIRQEAALGVWHAVVTDPRTGRDEVVGHALCVPMEPDHPAWSEVDDPAVVRARTAGSAVLLGALAVDPAWVGRGVAGRLVRARLEHLRRRDLLPCASVWDAAPGSLALAHRHGRPVGRHPSQPQQLFVYDR
ncbi:hypothetical protein GCM10022215_26970 [Nocardioides fonticola]|uniref:N-acetyltransferase domain-containing protein n=1 Tax=Nocardioides fonticola TaxID=450363 RepID=A0ABP7XMV8_9ACTN